MIITPKLGEALMIALDAGHTLVRCAHGFQDPGARRYAEYEGHIPSITRRTANTLVNACLAEFNDPDVPSALTLTDRGFNVALAHARATLAKVAA